MLRGVHVGRYQGLFHLLGGLGRSGVEGGVKMELTKHTTWASAGPSPLCSDNGAAALQGSLRLSSLQPMPQLLAPTHLVTSRTVLFRCVMTLPLP